MSSSCATTHALLSGLVGRVRGEGWVPPAEDLLALLRLGLAPEEVDAALARVGTEASQAARLLLALQVAGLQRPKAP